MAVNNNKDYILNQLDNPYDSFEVNSPEYFEAIIHGHITPEPIFHDQEAFISYIINNTQAVNNNQDSILNQPDNPYDSFEVNSPEYFEAIIHGHITPEPILHNQEAFSSYIINNAQAIIAFPPVPHNHMVYLIDVVTRHCTINDKYHLILGKIYIRLNNNQLAMNHFKSIIDDIENALPYIIKIADILGGPIEIAKTALELNLRYNNDINLSTTIAEEVLERLSSRMQFHTNDLDANKLEIDILDKLINNNENNIRGLKIATLHLAKQLAKQDQKNNIHEELITKALSVLIDQDPKATSATMNNILGIYNDKLHSYFTNLEKVALASAKNINPYNTLTYLDNYLNGKIYDSMKIECLNKLIDGSTNTEDLEHIVNYIIEHLENSENLDQDKYKQLLSESFAKYVCQNFNKGLKFIQDIVNNSEKTEYYQEVEAMFLYKMVDIYKEPLLAFCYINNQENLGKSLPIISQEIGILYHVTNSYPEQVLKYVEKRCSGDLKNLLDDYTNVYIFALSRLLCNEINNNQEMDRNFIYDTNQLIKDIKIISDYNNPKLLALKGIVSWRCNAWKDAADSFQDLIYLKFKTNQKFSALEHFYYIDSLLKLGNFEYVVKLCDQAIRLGLDDKQQFYIMKLQASLVMQNEYKTDTSLLISKETIHKNDSEESNCYLEIPVLQQYKPNPSKKRILESNNQNDNPNKLYKIDYSYINLEYITTGEVSNFENPYDQSS